MYRAGYMNDPSNRARGFMIGFLVAAALMLGSVVGAVMKLL
jgi:tetrahydromethanopterin S-methyltransferase subunit F